MSSLLQRALPNNEAISLIGGSATVRDRLLPAFFATMLGCLILGITGFAHIEAVHNAAHDTRHANGFPCH